MKAERYTGAVLFQALLELCDYVANTAGAGMDKDALVKLDLVRKGVEALAEKSRREAEIVAKLEEPSEAFQRAITNSGSADINCELCGRWHFADEHRSIIDEDSDKTEKQVEQEWEALLRRADDPAEKVVYHAGCDSVSWGHIDGQQVVPNCPCNLARRYENFIWNHRYLISDYYRERAKEIQADAEEAADIAGRTKTKVVDEKLTPEQIEDLFWRHRHAIKELFERKAEEMKTQSLDACKVADSDDLFMGARERVRRPR